MARAPEPAAPRAAADRRGQRPRRDRRRRRARAWSSIKAELDALYARYLREAGWQAALGAVAVALLLALHLRSARRLLRGRCCRSPPPALVVLAALAAAGAALGILHLVGLLLTVAIGSNYALFFDHLRRSRRRSTRTRSPRCCSPT